MSASMRVLPPMRDVNASSDAPTELIVAIRPLA